MLSKAGKLPEHRGPEAQSVLMKLARMVTKPSTSRVDPALEPVPQAAEGSEPEPLQAAPAVPSTLKNGLSGRKRPASQVPVEAEVETDRDEISLDLGSGLQVAPAEVFAALQAALGGW